MQLGDGELSGSALTTAWIDGKVIAKGAPYIRTTGAPFAFLAASYATEAGNNPGPDNTDTTDAATAAAAVAVPAEFKDLCLTVNELVPARVHAGASPMPPGPPSPPSPPMQGHGLGMAACTDRSDGASDPVWSHCKSNLPLLV
eukprot:SAG22_NODE_3493_length_1683_cov_1.063131_3_plen_143_part_00